MERIEVERSSAASVERGREGADFLFRLQALRTHRRPNVIPRQPKTQVARDQAKCSLPAQRERSARAQVRGATNLKSIVPLNRPTERDTLAAAGACESR